MALNPQLVSYGANAAPFPAPYQGEYVCAQRDACDFKAEGAGLVPRFSGSGTAFLTNYRLIFVPKKATAQVQAIELPLLYIEKEDVRQPILGCNYLCGVCRPVEAPPNSSERISFNLYFTSGGMGTIVPLLFGALQYIRVASGRAHHARDPAAGPARPATEPPTFLQSALLDPADPTKVYLTQQVAPDQQAQTPKFQIVA